jgi:hypothetical protein
MLCKGVVVKFKTFMVFFLLLSINLFGDELNFDFRKHIILREHPEHKEIWIPTREQIHNTLFRIMDMLNTPPSKCDARQKRQLLKIKRRFSTDYRVQFVGIEVQGQKRIWCNFFPSKGYENWRSQLVTTKGGGDDFWRITYDIDTDLCRDFNINKMD